MNIATALDQMANVLLWPTGLGSGDPDQTLSHYWATLSAKGVRWARAACLVLTWVEGMIRKGAGLDPKKNGHCYSALVADVEGYNTPEKQDARVKAGQPRIISCLR